MKKTLSWLRRHRVAVLKGGWSRERPISLKTGQAVEQAFKRLQVPAISIDINRDFIDQLKKHRIEFCFVALHGSFGEDGQIQTILDFLKIPYTGEGPLASALAMDKEISKKLFVQANVPTPEWVVVSKSESKATIKSLLRKKSALFIKPFDQGSALGATCVRNQKQIVRALNDCFRVSKKALAETYIEGRELTVGILGKQILPVVEIIPKHVFYDFHSKYATGGSRHIVPANLPNHTSHKVQMIAKEAFDALGCSVYGRVDILLKKNGQASVLEVNTIPGMTNTSLLPDAARAEGIQFDDLVLRICELSLLERGTL